MTCKTCGAEILPEDTYCKNCGRTITLSKTKLNLEDDEEQYIIDIRKQPALSIARKGLYRYFDTNSIFSFLIPFAPLLTLLYPIYLLCGKIDGLYSVYSFFSSFSAVLEISFILGAIFCFTLGQKLLLTISFGLLGLNTILTLTEGGSTTFNSIFKLILFIALSILVYKSTAFNSDLDTSVSWRSISAKAIVIGIIVILAILLVISLLGAVKQCDICGELITEGYEYNDTTYCKECFWTN